MTFSFFLNIKNPLIGYFNKFFALVYSARDGLGTSQSNILPSDPKESKLKFVYTLPGGR
jgi:hypothetical protein